MDSKPFWASKTIWVNFIAIAAAIAATLGMDVGPEFQATAVAFIMGVANIVLRMTTKNAIST